MQILGVSGSLRGASTNTRLLLAATQLLPSGVQMHVSSSVAALPLFSPDLDAAGSPPVVRWTKEVREASGLVISTPEYAGGYPGALKNAFDWLVATDAYVNKPFMLLNASPRSVVAQATFAKVLATMSGVHVEGASTTIPLLGTKLDVSEILENHEYSERIRESLGRFAAEVNRRKVESATTAD